MCRINTFLLAQMAWVCNFVFSGTSQIFIYKTHYLESLLSWSMSADYRLKVCLC